MIVVLSVKQRIRLFVRIIRKEKEMLRSFPGEEWKEVNFEKGALTKRYSISSYGRIASYQEGIHKDANILKGGILGGYPTFVCRPFGKSKTFYIHKLVASYFLEEFQTEDTAYVIHLDFNKRNNRVENLKWATKREMELHQQNSPYVKESRKKRREKKPYKGHKLSATDVIRIKKKIFDPKRKTRLKIIAKQFGISEMQLYRIKSGENWAHVKVDIESN
jgi:hypothetical protein